MSYAPARTRVHRPLIAAFLAMLLAACPGKPDQNETAATETAAEGGAPPVAVTPRTDGDAVEHTLRFGRRSSHYISVESVYPTGGAKTLEIRMATWTPGSYLIREYARHIDKLEATALDGSALTVTKTAKNRWLIDTGGADRAVVRYELYARELTVRTNFVDSSIAVLNGAPTFTLPVEGGPERHDVLIEMPEDWARSVTALPPHPDGKPHHFAAPDYDTLADSPIILGNPVLHDFDVDGVPHTLANFGEDGVWDGPRSAKDVEALVQAQVDFWQTIPYDRYQFLNVLEESGGGLEHKASTLMLSSKWNTRVRDRYVRWLGLVSHEFFHTWNVKRLRPQALGPFDYENERHTRSLWVAEGLTSYYDNILLARAGLIDEDEFLDLLTEQIETFQSKPGRKVQSLSEASFDAWIKYYRSNENTRNTQVSYYTKGALVGFLLDAEIRQRTGGRKSLDDAMRLAYQRYSGETGYTPKQFRETVAEVAGGSVDEFYARYVDGTDELDYGPALAYFGLRFKPSAASAPGDDDQTPGWLGAVASDSGVVTRVPRDTPAHEAGVNVGDELIGVGDFHVGSSMDSFLDYFRPGDKVELLVARRGRLVRLPTVLGEEPDDSRWQVQVAPSSNQVAKARRSSLLGQ